MEFELESERVDVGEGLGVGECAKAREGVFLGLECGGEELKVGLAKGEVVYLILEGGVLLEGLLRHGASELVGFGGGFYFALDGSDIPVRIGLEMELLAFDVECVAGDDEFVFAFLEGNGDALLDECAVGIDGDFLDLGVDGGLCLCCECGEKECGKGDEL